MGKSRSSLFSFLFPWLSPWVIKFVLADGGIAVQFYRNDRLVKDWHLSRLHRVLPESLITWINENHIHIGPQPYPLIKQFWQSLLPLASKKLIIDASVLIELEEVNQPQDFALVWVLNCALERIEGHYEGIDHYLGMGWFQKGTKIWSMNNHLSAATDLPWKDLIMSIQQADFLLNSTIPGLQQYLPTRADFQLITNFDVRVIVPDARNGRLTLALQCNSPQFLPTVQVPQQVVDVLLANQAIIRFPHQALTPALIQLLQRGSSITIQGANVPLFIREQLPTMRHYHLISDEMAAKITQSNPIVSIATLQPTFTLLHRREDGIGKYIINATYQCNQHVLDISTFLAARQQNQRFAQQHATWFEWPSNSYDLANTIQQWLAIQVLRPEEVMGFDTKRVALLHDRPTAHTIQSSGTTPAERSQSFFAQLRHHGIPGGIFGEPQKLAAMFVSACENLLRDNRQARILWLAPSNKKGSVTRAVNGSTISSYVTVASPITLRDEPALVSHSWTLIIFQGLDILSSDGSYPVMMLSRLKWQWTLFSVTSRDAVSSSIMQVLHLPDQYREQFSTRYLFDPLKGSNDAVIGQRTINSNTTLTVSSIVPIDSLKSLNSPVMGQRTVSPGTAPTASPIVSKKDAAPLEQRVAVLKRYWNIFDEIHARQKAGMKPLWGLVEEFSPV